MHIVSVWVCNCIYVYICIYIYMCIFINKNSFISMSTSIPVSVSAYIQIRYLYVHMYSHMYIRAYVCRTGATTLSPLITKRAKSYRLHSYVSLDCALYKIVDVCATTTGWSADRQHLNRIQDQLLEESGSKAKGLG